MGNKFGLRALAILFALVMVVSCITPCIASNEDYVLATQEDIFLETFGSDHELWDESYVWYRGEEPLYIVNSGTDPAICDNEGVLTYYEYISTGNDAYWHLDGDLTAHSTAAVRGGKLYLRQYIKDGRPGEFPENYFHGTNRVTMRKQISIEGPISGLNHNSRVAMDLSLLDSGRFLQYGGYPWRNAEVSIRLYSPSGTLVSGAWRVADDASGDLISIGRLQSFESFDVKISDFMGYSDEEFDERFANDRSVTLLIEFNGNYQGSWDRWGYEGVYLECAVDNIRIYNGKPLTKGDLLLGEGAKIVPGPWSHIGMYIGNGQVVESHIALGGVDITPLESWFDRYKTWAALRVVSADDEIREEAINWATHPDRLDDPYDLMWLLKDPNGEAWYCSELVWAAYLHASNGQINIEYGPDITGITPYEIMLDEETEIIAEHYEEVPKSGFTIKTKCPVDLEVVDPDNLPVNKQSITIPGAIYGEDDSDGDGRLEDWIGIPERKIGNYLISVIPEPDASPTDTYTLEVLLEDDTTIVLAENVQISDIPSQPYMIKSTETTVIQIIPATIDFDPDTLNLKLWRHYGVGKVEFGKPSFN